MKITGNQVFPNIMLAVGLASILLVSMPAQIAYSAPLTWTDARTGATVTVDSNKNTITYPDGSSRIEIRDPTTGKLTSRTDYDGRGSGSTWNYNQETGGLTSRVSWSASDPGGVSTISYDGKSSSCKDVGDQGCMGHVTKTDITNGKTGQEYVRTFDQKGNETSNQVKDKAGNVTDIKSVGAGTSATTRDSKGNVTAQKDTYPDGTTNSRTYFPDGKVKSVEMYDPASKQTRVSDYKSDGSVGSLSVKDSTGKLISKTDKGPNKYEKTTTYDPKTGFMTSQSETQADGKMHQVNYTGNCSQFGGSDCHKVSELTSDAKTGKISAAKFCDNQGNCKDADPNNLISAGGGPVQPGPQAVAGKTAPVAGDKPGGDRRASPPKVTKNADGSTTSVRNNPDGSTSARTTSKDGSMKVVRKNADGSTSTTEIAKDGKTLGIRTFDASGKQISATAFGQDGKKTLYRTFDDKGGTVTGHFDSNGVRLTSIDTIDANGKLTHVSCTNPAKCADAAKALNQHQVQISGAEKPPAGARGAATGPPQREAEC